MSFLQSPLEPQQSDEVCFVFCPKRLSQGSAALSPVPPESWLCLGTARGLERANRAKCTAFYLFI